MVAQGPLTYGEAVRYLKRRDYATLSQELDKRGASFREPDADCEVALREGLNEQTLASPRGLMQWIMCRAHQHRRERDVEMREALVAAWGEAEMKGERRNRALSKGARRRVPDSIQQDSDAYKQAELPDWFARRRGPGTGTGGRSR